jgi:flavodoxin
MKTKILLLIFGFVVMGGVFAQEKTLVVYYSRTGHTKMVAERLAKKFNADIEPLIDQKNRLGLMNAFGAGKDAIGYKTTELEPIKHDLKDYTMIIIGGPSWFGNTTPAVRTFITQHDLKGKKVALFGMCHVSGVENALKEAAELVSQDRAKKIPTLPLREGELKDPVLSKKIDAFYQAVTAQ